MTDEERKTISKLFRDLTEVIWELDAVLRNVSDLNEEADIIKTELQRIMEGNE